MEYKLQEAKDFYAKHKLGSRIAMILFIIVYSIIMIYPLMIKDSKIINEHIYSIMVDTSSTVAIIAFITTILGANALEKIIERWIKIKNNES